MVTKLGPLRKVKLLKDKGDTLVVRSPEKAGVGGSTPSLATMFSVSVPETWVTERSGDIGYTFGPKGFSSGSNSLVSRSKYPRS